MKKPSINLTSPKFIICVAVLVVISGIGIYFLTKNSEEKPSNKQTSQQLPESLDKLKSTDEIRQLAIPKLGTARIVSIELEQEDTGAIYRVKLSDGKVLYFNAKTGASITKEQAGSDDSTAEKDTAALPAGFTPSITLEQARKTAQEKRPGKTISKIELEPEDGIVVYSVRFSDDGRVDINATNGQITRVQEPGQNATTAQPLFDGGTGNEDFSDVKPSSGSSDD